MSVNHITFGACGRNWRLTRSSATLTPGTRIVVRPRFFATSPEIPAGASVANPLLADPDVVSHPQLRVDSTSTIDTTVSDMDLPDLLGQPRVTELPV